MSDEMVSINQVVDLIKELSRGSLRTVVGRGTAYDCDSRCGCVGQECGCYNQVSSKFERLSWVEFQSMREQRVQELKRQLTALEDDTPPRQVR